MVLSGIVDKPIHVIHPALTVPSRIEAVVVPVSCGEMEQGAFGFLIKRFAWGSHRVTPQDGAL